MGDQEEENAPENVFNAPDCKCETVVVYLDRAEVCRTLQAKLKEGENEVIIKELSACIDKDSIRWVVVYNIEQVNVAHGLVLFVVHGNEIVLVYAY